MNGEPAQPAPAQVPMLTEVIELVPPTPVAEAGMARAARPAAPAPGAPGSEPIVTGGLGSGQRPSWSPMNTVVLPTLNDVAMPPAVIPANLAIPVLDAVVPEELTGDVALTQLEAVPAPAAQTVTVPAPQAPPVAQAAPAPTQPVLPDITEAQLAQRVLGVVQKQVDGMIDFRLKEAMAPILARHSEALVRDLREELSRTMSDVVARAVAQEMAKLRQR